MANGGYPAPGYRAGAQRYAAPSRLSNAGAAGLMESMLSAANPDSPLNKALQETARREASRGSTVVPRSFLRRGADTRKALSLLRAASRASPLNRASAAMDAILQIGKALGMLPDDLLQPYLVLDYPGFSLKHSCGNPGFPYNAAPSLQGPFPAGSLGCIGGQYPLEPGPIGGTYTQLATEIGLAEWCERYDAGIDPRCATFRIYEPIAGVQAGGSPYSVYAMPVSGLLEPPAAEDLPYGALPNRAPDPRPYGRSVGPPPGGGGETGEQGSRDPSDRRRRRREPRRRRIPRVRPPGRGERERKSYVPGWLLRAVGSGTEALDAVGALYRALPCEVQCQAKRGKKGVYFNEKARLLWENWRKLDAGKAAFELAWNALEDRAYAATGRGIAHSYGYGYRRNPQPSQLGNESDVGRLPLDELKPKAYKALTGKDYTVCKCSGGKPK